MVVNIFTTSRFSRAGAMIVLAAGLLALGGCASLYPPDPTTQMGDWQDDPYGLGYLEGGSSPYETEITDGWGDYPWIPANNFYPGIEYGYGGTSFSVSYTTAYRNQWGYGGCGIWYQPYYCPPYRYGNGHGYVWHPPYPRPHHYNDYYFYRPGYSYPGWRNSPGSNLPGSSSNPVADTSPSLTAPATPVYRSTDPARNRASRQPPSIPEDTMSVRYGYGGSGQPIRIVTPPPPSAYDRSTGPSRTSPYAGINNGSAARVVPGQPSRVTIPTRIDPSLLTPAQPRTGSDRQPVRVYRPSTGKQSYYKPGKPGGAGTIRTQPGYGGSRTTHGSRAVPRSSSSLGASSKSSSSRASAISSSSSSLSVRPKSSSNER